jgi:hypothetical protein
MPIQRQGLNQLITGAITRAEFSAIERELELLQISRSAMVRECITFYLANHTDPQTAKSAS